MSSAGDVEHPQNVASAEYVTVEEDCGGKLQASGIGEKVPGGHSWQDVAKAFEKVPAVQGGAAAAAAFCGDSNNNTDANNNMKGAMINDLVGLIITGGYVF